METIKRIWDSLVNVPSADPDNARRRKLLNILLASVICLTLATFLAAILDLVPPAIEEHLFYTIIAAILFSVVIVFLINRYGLGQLARFLFLLVLTAFVFINDPQQMTSGRGLLMLTVPIFIASFLLRPYASFVVALVVSFLLLGIAIRLQLGMPDLVSLASFFLIALVSWITARGLERVLGNLRIVNRELDQRIAERTRDLHRRSIQLQTASEVARDATATLNAQQLLDDTVRLISERFGFYHVGVFLTDDDREHVILRAASSRVGQQMLEDDYRLAIGEDVIVGHVADTGEHLVVLDVGRDAARYVNPYLSDTRSEMALPLASRGNIIGVLDVHSTQRNTFTNEDVAALQTMADQLANAIESARSFELEQQRRQEAETLYRATQALVSTLDLQRVFEHILSELQQVVAYDSASVQILKDGQLEIIGGRGFPNLDELLGLAFDLSNMEAPNGEVVRRRAPVILDNALATYEGFRREPHAPAQIRSWLGVPLILGDRLLGMLALDKRESSFYTEEHARLASAFAVQAAIAIDNARLYEEAQRHVEELTALHNIDVAMISTLDLDEVLLIIYQQVSEILTVTAFYIALYDDRRDEIEVSFLLEKDKRKEPFTLPLDDVQGSVGWVVRHQKPLWIDDLAQADNQTALTCDFVDSEVKSLMVLPLIVGGRLIGVIAVHCDVACAFDESDRTLFSNIAHQAAIAITNAQLYQQVRKRLDEAQLVQEVMLMAASTLDFDLVLERTVKALHRALGIRRLGFLLPDERGEMLVPHPSLVGFAEDAPRIPIAGTLVGEVYRTGRSFLLRDVGEQSDYFYRDPEVCSALAMAVRIGDRAAAVLLAESTKQGAFGEDEARIFATVAGQLGVVLENARLYQEMTGYTRDLRLLAGASAGMIGALQPEEIVAHLLDALVERFQAPCCISLMEPDGESARIMAGWVPGGQPLPIGYDVHISHWDGLSRLMETRRLVYDPAARESRWQGLLSSPEMEIMCQQDIEAGLILPMLSQDQLVGIVSLGFSEPLPEPVGEQLDWVQALVNQAAAALSSAQLYKQLENQTAELSRAYSELQEIDRLRTQMVQNVGHELRTPLSLIKGYVELLIGGDLGPVVKSQRDALQIVRERTASLSRLIHNLVMLQAVPREALDITQVSIVEVVHQVMDEFQRSAEEAGIVFRDEMPEGLPPTLGDQDRLQLAFNHLLDNAIKFSPDGGQVTLRAWSDEEMLHVSVIDQGIGISPQSLGRIFERFYQVDGSTRRRFGGMGIGLALVWEIIEVHQGTVLVESEPEKGSTFTVSLPIAEI